MALGHQLACAGSDADCLSFSPFFSTRQSKGFRIGIIQACSPFMRRTSGLSMYTLCVTLCARVSALVLVIRQCRLHGCVSSPCSCFQCLISAFYAFTCGALLHACTVNRYRYHPRAHSGDVPVLWIYQDVCERESRRCVTRVQTRMLCGSGSGRRACFLRMGSIAGTSRSISLCCDTRTTLSLLTIDAAAWWGRTDSRRHRPL